MTYVTISIVLEYTALQWLCNTKDWYITCNPVILPVHEHNPFWVINSSFTERRQSKIDWIVMSQIDAVMAKRIGKHGTDRSALPFYEIFAIFCVQCRCQRMSLLLRRNAGRLATQYKPAFPCQWRFWRSTLQSYITFGCTGDITTMCKPASIYAAIMVWLYDY